MLLWYYILELWQCSQISRRCVDAEVISSKDQNIIFNAETKIPLPKEELSKIDWYGESAGQQREQWIYKDIYEIQGTEKTEAVAVQINDRYYIAKRQ